MASRRVQVFGHSQRFPAEILQRGRGAAGPLSAQTAQEAAPTCVCVVGSLAAIGSSQGVVSVFKSVPPVKTASLSAPSCLDTCSA